MTTQKLMEEVETKISVVFSHSTLRYDMTYLFSFPVIFFSSSYIIYKGYLYSHRMDTFLTIWIMLLRSCSACTRRRLDSAAMFPLGDLSHRFICPLTLMDLSKFGGFMSYKADPPPPSVWIQFNFDCDNWELYFLPAESVGLARLLQDLREVSSSYIYFCFSTYLFLSKNRDTGPPMQCVVMNWWLKIKYNSVQISQHQVNDSFVGSCYSVKFYNSHSHCILIAISNTILIPDEDFLNEKVNTNALICFLKF
jgi:hypothetical protein